MVNHLMRRHAASLQGIPEAEGRVYVEYLGAIPQVIGPTTFTTGTQDWMPWSTSKPYRDDGSVKVLEYEEVLIGQTEGTDDPAGFVCPHCGTRFARARQLLGHTASHFTKERPEKPKTERIPKKRGRPPKVRTRRKRRKITESQKD